jgi:hypothetical protein
MEKSGDTIPCMVEMAKSWQNMVRTLRETGRLLATDNKSKGIDLKTMCIAKMPVKTDQNNKIVLQCENRIRLAKATDIL